MNSDLTSDILIKDNTFTRCNLREASVLDAAIFMVQGSTSWTPGDNIVIEGNSISDSYGRAISIGYTNAVVRRNVIRNVLSAGTTAAIRVLPYTSSGTQAAITNIEVTDNDIDGSAGFGIMVGSSAAMTTGVVIKNNRIRDCVLSGVYATPAEMDDLTISDNSISNCNTGDDQYHAGVRVGIDLEADVSSKPRTGGGPER